jgi:hypothetical protein
MPVYSKHYSFKIHGKSYVYWTVHYLGSWLKRDQLDVTCFFISLFNSQHVSYVNTSILRSLRLVCCVISCVVLLWYDVCWCYGVVRVGWCGILMRAEALVLQPACVLVLRCGSAGVVWYPYAGWGTSASACMCVGVTVWFGWGGVVTLCRLKQLLSSKWWNNKASDIKLVYLYSATIIVCIFVSFRLTTCFGPHFWAIIRSHT